MAISTPNPKVLAAVAVASVSSAVALLTVDCDHEPAPPPEVTQLERAKKPRKVVVITGGDYEPARSDEPKKETPTPPLPIPLFNDFRDYYSQAVNFALYDLQTCWGSSLNCKPNAPWELYLGFTNNPNRLDWPISCRSSYPYEQVLYMAVNPFSNRYTFSNTDLEFPSLAPAFMQGNESSYDACEAALAHMESQRGELEVAEENLGDFFTEQEFVPEKDEDGSNTGCYVTTEEGPGSFMDVCNTGHPLSYEIWVGDLNESGEVEWWIEGEVVKAEGPWSIEDMIIQLVDENIGLLDADSEQAYLEADTGGWYADTGLIE